MGCYLADHMACNITLSISLSRFQKSQLIQYLIKLAALHPDHFDELQEFGSPAGQVQKSNRVV
jgi:hypothetical protein